MLTDLDEAGLATYRSTQTEPSDFAEFWDRTLTETRRTPMRPGVVDVVTPLTSVRVRDVTFPGFGADPIRAWLLTPASSTGRLPAVVHFVGYGGGRGVPLEHTAWPSCGFAQLVVDTRGQGSRWARGDTPDPAPVPSAGGEAITRGIEDIDGYYYRRVLADAVRAVEAVASLREVDPDRIAVVGGSQGGGVALAAAALAPERVAALAASVPFLCDLPRAVRIAGEGPSTEVVEYLRVRRGRQDAVLRTLSYVDGVNMARRASAPAYFSAGLMDPICPPSTVFGAYHAYAGPKEMRLWPFNGHEGGGSEDLAGAIGHVSRALAG